MKSIKPGRGPSMMGAFGSAAAVVFGIIWTFATVSMGAPTFFSLFGIVFVAMGIVQVIYNYKNATGKNRFSAFDITDGHEETDPLNEYFAKEQRNEDISKFSSRNSVADESNNFCPYCGDKVANDHVYCSNCGKQLPR